MPELRRIALLLRSLDGLAAEVVLSRMPDDVRASVVEAMEQVADADTPECEEVARDFLGGMRRVVQDRSNANTNLSPAIISPSTLETATFESLVDNLPVGTLADLVQHEHPQICAVVVTRLSPGRAAELLQAIAPHQRTDVLRRVLELDEVDPAAVAQIRDNLAARLRDQLLQQQQDTARIRRVEAILGAADPKLRNDLMEVVEQSASSSPARPGNEPIHRDALSGKYDDPVQTSVSFDRLVDCEDKLLQDLFSAIPVDVSAVALSGASQPVRSHILDRLPQETTTVLTQRLDSAGPIRVADIHIAQAIVLRMLERSVTSMTPVNHRMTLSA